MRQRIAMFDVLGMADRPPADRCASSGRPSDHSVISSWDRDR